MKKNKQQVIKNANKKETKNPLQRELKNMAYVMSKNNFTVKNINSLVHSYQHLWFMQAVSKDSGYNFGKMKYFDSLKKSFESIFNKIFKTAYKDPVTDKLVIDENLILGINKITRNKIFWFIYNYYELTANIINHHRKSIPKYLNYAFEMVEFRLKLLYPEQYKVMFSK